MKRFYRIGAILLAVLVLLTPSMSAVGFEYDTAAKEAYEKKLAEAKAHKEELEESKKQAEELIARYKEQQADIAAYIEELDSKLGDIAMRLIELQDEIKQTEEDLKNAVVELTEAEKRRDEQYETMKKRVRYIYENGETTYLDVLLTAGSISDILNQMEYVSSIQKYDNSLLERYQETCEEVEAKKAMLEATLDSLTAMREREELEQATIQELYDLKSAEIEAVCEQLGIADEVLFNYIDQISSQEFEIEEIIAAEEKRVEEEERKRKEEEERLRQEEEKRRLAEQRAAEARKSGTSGSKVYDPDAINYVVQTDETDPYNMIWPLPGDHSTFSKFGPRKAPLPGASTYHQGWDIGGKSGSPIVAVLAGTVIVATNNSSAGYYIKIEHECGLVTVYMHMLKGSFKVEVGDYVKQGQVIGLCGSTGCSTGPHLHFGIQSNGVYIDPEPYIGHLE